MKISKKWIAAMGCALMLGTVGAGTMAVSAQEAESPSIVETGDHKAEKNRSFEGAMEKWNALTDAQKAEVYALLAARNQADGAFLDRLAELGVLDAEMTAKIKEHMQERLDEAQKTGEFPMNYRPGRGQK